MANPVLTKLFMMEIGDRFYFAKDRSRHVWQVIDIETVVIERFHSAPYESRKYILQDDNRKQSSRAGNPEVMFIRKADVK